MSFLLPFSMAAAIAAVAALLTARLARITGAVARPRSDRWHRGREIPRLGGPALLVALIPWVDASALFVLAGFCAIGAWDDHRPLGAGPKAMALLIPCAVASAVSGIWWVGPACWVAANAVNMLDHADGVAVSACAASLIVADGPLGPSGAGASIGFLAHNWPPARSFLGDSGSLMLGALLVMAWSRHGAVPTLAGAAVPLLDAAFVIVRRVRGGRRPWFGGTDHSAHVLLARGVPPATLPLLYGAASAGVASIGAALA